MKNYGYALNVAYELKNQINELDNMIKKLNSTLSNTVTADGKILSNEEYKMATAAASKAKTNANSLISVLSQINNN